MTHVALLLAFSIGVGTVLAAILRREPREIVGLAARISGGMSLAGVLIAWLLYLLSR